MVQQGAPHTMVLPELEPNPPKHIELRSRSSKFEESGGSRSTKAEHRLAMLPRPVKSVEAYFCAIEVYLF